jgi:hypothetical protein
MALCLQGHINIYDIYADVCTYPKAAREETRHFAKQVSRTPVTEILHTALRILLLLLWRIVGNDCYYFYSVVVVLSLCFGQCVAQPSLVVYLVKWCTA